MSRSYSNWIIIYDGGETQQIQARDIYDIIHSDELEMDSENIITIIKLQ